MYARLAFRLSQELGLPFCQTVSIIRLVVRKPKREPGDAERILSHSDPEAGELFDLAIRVKELAPWRWMEEIDLIGIENPETGEIAFISVMGSVGEYEAIAVYLGAEGFYGFIDFVEDDTATADRLVELPHLQAAFSERKYLEKQDRALIKHWGLKSSGATVWPMFRSYRPGYFPWFVTIAEGRFLIHALLQILDVARRVRSDAQPFHPTGRVEKDGYLMRVSRKDGSQLIWEDQVWRIPKPTPKPIRTAIDRHMLESLKQISPGRLDLEADFLLSPASIGKHGQRPLAVYTLMIADHDSGFIFGFDVMSVEDSLSSMHARIPNAVAKILLQNQIVPRRLIVRSDRLRGLLKPLAQSLNIVLQYSRELPRIDEAAESLGEWLRGSMP